MPVPTSEEFWQSLVRHRLLEAGAVAALRAEHAALPPAAAGDGSAKAIAVWLVNRGAITRWQARRLALGDGGPFFLGDYRLLERHEREGDALLFTARHDPTGRDVALVLLNAKRCRELDVWTAIVERTAAAHRTADPMSSRTWALEQQDGARFIVCELVTGTNVADELERLGPMPPQQAGVLACQIARAVGELHALGGVHGSLSLDALRREPPPAGGGERNGRVRLLQFPLTGDPHVVINRPAAQDEADLARLGRRAGYVAPEVFRSDAACDARSDVYALGAMLHAFLSGRHPCWDGGSVTAVRAAETLGPAPLPDSVPPGLREVVSGMMARDPEARFPTGGTAAAAIAAAVGLAIPAAPVQSAATPFLPAADVPEAEVPQFTLDVSRSSRPQPSAASQASGRVTTTSEAGRRRARVLRLIGGLTVGALLVATAVVVASRSGGGRTRAPVGKAGRSTASPPKADGPRPDGGRTADSGEAAESTASRTRAAAPTSPAPEAADASTRLPVVSRGVAPQLVVDADDLPWASPTSGMPPTLAYLPPGSQLVLLARLAAVEADAEGRLFLKSLGAEAAAAIDGVVKLCGGDPQAIDLVQAGWQAGGPDEVLGAYAVRFRAGRAAPADEATRAECWGPTQAEVLEGETVHQSAGLSFWLPADEQGRVLVVAPRVMVPKDVALGPAAGAAAAQEPLIARIIRETLPLARDRSAALQATLPRDLEVLVGMLDADRHVTLFGSPHYLLNTGRPLLAGPLAKLAEPMDALFGESLQGAALSLQFGEASYVEMDAVATLDVPAKTLAAEIAGRVEGLAPAVEAFCTALNPDPYGRVLVNRLPGMLRVLTAQVRSGAEGRAVVLNAYLPRHALHNIALAAELALAQTPGAAAVTAGPATAAPATAATGALARLAAKLTLTFAKDNLERSIQMVSDETGVPMEILGGDLQLEGITKNQSFGLDEKDKTADEILRVILAKSNPEGKLVYVVKEKDGEEWVFITTRAAVAKRGDTLPPAYAPPK